MKCQVWLLYLYKKLKGVFKLSRKNIFLFSLTPVNGKANIFCLENNKSVCRIGFIYNVLHVSGYEIWQMETKSCVKRFLKHWFVVVTTCYEMKESWRITMSLYQISTCFSKSCEVNFSCFNFLLLQTQTCFFFISSTWERWEKLWIKRCIHTNDNLVFMCQIK